VVVAKRWRKQNDQVEIRPEKVNSEHAEGWKTLIGESKRTELA